MFRTISRRMFARTAVLLDGPLHTHDIPEGFHFVENKVVDKDIHSAYDHLETLKLTLTRQDEFLLNDKEVKCVTVSGVNGDYGIYPGHAYKITQLVPSTITVEYPEGNTKKYFTSGGFAQINNVGSCDINTVECIPIEELDMSIAEKELAEQHNALTSAKDEKAKSVVEIRIEVLEAVIAALKQHH